MFALLLLLSAPHCAPWPDDPATAAYAALRGNRLDSAVSSFRQALPCNPGNARLHKDFAYTLLRTGDRLAARAQFARSLEIDPADEAAALEAAFLDYETGRRREARSLFLKLKSSSNPGIQAKAARAFDEIDQALAAAIGRWRQALQRAPDQWSGHEELAHLAEQRDDLPLASSEFLQAWTLRPARLELLLDLARVWTGQGDTVQARRALVTAWRHGPPRVAETARELLHGEVPAETEIALVVPKAQPEDAAGPELDAREMGARSLANSYLNDALKYLTLAHQRNPADAEVLYQLGLTNNLLHRDADALGWFAQARRAADPEISAKAARAWSTLHATQPGFHVSVWFAPTHSSYWDDLFLYSQARLEYRPAHSRFTPYVSLRFLGDTSNGFPWVAYSYLSETRIIGAAGLQVRLHPRAYGWFEAGAAFNYGGRRNTDLATPDYRGGLSWSKGWGRLFGNPESGRFAESHVDGVYIHRHWDDKILYVQNAAGYTVGTAEGAAWSAYMNFNLVADSGGDQWANKIEYGPGMRFVVKGMPRGMSIRYDILRWRRTMPNSPIGVGGWDVRTGLWYAFTH